MNTSTSFIDETTIYIYKEIVHKYMPEFIKEFEYTPWIFSLIGAALIGLSGILPLAIIPSNEEELKDGNFKDRK